MAATVKGYDKYILFDGLKAGEALTEGDAVYVKASDGKVWKAKGDAVTTVAHGIAARTVTSAQVTAADSTAVVTVYSKCVVNGYTGLTPGATQWLSAATGGARTETAPAVPNVNQCLGRAQDATTIVFDVDGCNYTQPGIASAPFYTGILANGVTTAAGDAVYITSTGTIALADGVTPTTKRAMGFVKDVVVGDGVLTISVYKSVYQTVSGKTIGLPVYLDIANPGKHTQTAPGTNAKSRQAYGVALSATLYLLDISLNHDAMVQTAGNSTVAFAA